VEDQDVISTAWSLLYYREIQTQRTKRDRMIKKRTIKVIKRQEPNTRERRSEAEPDGGSNMWSKSVRLWVDQYRQASAKRPPAFDRLFKDSQRVDPVPLND
jgi:hypothetical protein